MLKQHRNRLNQSYMAKGFLFLLPATLVYLFFAVIPFFDNFLLSFQDWNGFGERTLIGVGNYIEAFKDKNFLLAIRNSVYFGVFSSFFSVILGVLLAWLLLYSKSAAGAFYRTILFSPSMIPAIITGLIFSFVYEPEIGILNKLLEVVHLENLQHAWLTNRSTVLTSLLFVSIWKQVGLTMVLCFAGMQSISPSLLESAHLEGAGDWKIFTKIILPLTMSFVQLSAIFALMSGLKIYDTVLALTNGGPGKISIVMPMWIMQSAFSFNQYGYSASMSVIFVLIVLLAMLITKRLIKGGSYEL
jgi:raffinose/stachyose/melibiose transport system permease protein